jgi:hypothetical protein
MASFIQAKERVPSFDDIEVRFLLQFIAASTFKGENVKILNSIVQKLEKQLHG